MGYLGRSLYYLAIVLVIMSIMMGEVDARRKILRGRKTMTKQYYARSPIPAWAIVTIVGVSMIALGGIFYFVMRKVILGGTNRDEYDPNA